MIYKSYLVEKNLSSMKENIFLIYGENLGLKNYFKRTIKSNNTNAEIINYNQEEILRNENNFFNEISNISLFETKKIYLIEQTNDKILKLLEEIKDKIQDQKIYLFSEILEKKSKLRNYFEKSKNLGTVPCYHDNEITIKKIILENLKNFDGLTNLNINLILNSSNLDRDKLHNELEKIRIFFLDKKIETEKLNKLLDLKINDSFALLRDVVLIGNKAKTNNLLSDTVLDSEKIIFHLATLNQRLNMLLQVKKKNNTDALEASINSIKPPVFWKDKPIFIAQANKLNQKKIRTILKKTYDFEIKVKSQSSIDKNILMKKLMVDICQLASS